MSSLNSISSEKLWRLIGVPHGPALVDVRPKEDFAADPRFIPGAVRRAHATVADWGSEFAGRSAVVICENGQGLSEGVAAWLRHAGASSAESLVGGHAAWAKAGLPLVPESKLPPRDSQGRTVWVTRSRPKIDRIACPWLIRRFVDPNRRIPVRFARGGARGRRALQRRAVRHRRRLLEPPRRPLHLRYAARRIGASNRTARETCDDGQGRGHRAPRSRAGSSRAGRRLARVVAHVLRRSRAACGGHDAL